MTKCPCFEYRGILWIKRKRAEFNESIEERALCGISLKSNLLWLPEGENVGFPFAHPYNTQYLFNLELLLHMNKFLVMKAQLSHWVKQTRQGTHCPQSSAKPIVHQGLELESDSFRQLVSWIGNPSFTR